MVMNNESVRLSPRQIRRRLEQIRDLIDILLGLLDPSPSPTPSSAGVTRILGMNDDGRNVKTARLIEYNNGLLENQII